MAKQTLKSLLGSNDEREQVELGLSPQALTPSVRSGGNYRVAVQQTPKTNQALQLSQALKQSIGVYNQVVDINQKRAAEDVATMSTDEFDNILQQGLDKEGKSLFGYTKAYNEALTQKYYAEEMPKKLQDISTELFKDPYAYKDTEAFEQAATAAIDEAYDEANKLLGDNVFASRAHAILKNKTREQFINQERAKYMERLPALTKEMQSEAAFRQFQSLDDFTQTGTTIEGALLSASSKMSKKEAASVVTSSYFGEIERAIKDGEYERADALLSELDDEQNGEGRRKFNGQEIFNTKSNQIKINDLENELEREQNKGLQTSRNTATRALADLHIEVEKTFGPSEDEGALDNYLDVLLFAAQNKGSVNIGGELAPNSFDVFEGGETFDDPIVVSALITEIRRIKSNPIYFKNTMAANFIAQHSQQYASNIESLITANGVYGVSEEVAGKMYSDGVDGIGNNIKIPTAFGVQLRNQFKAEHDIQKQAIYNRVKHLPMGDREMEFKKLYSEELTPYMIRYRDELINSYSTTPEKKKIEESKNEQVRTVMSEEEEKKLREEYSEEDAQAIIESKLEEARLDQMMEKGFISQRLFSRDEEGNQQLRQDSEYTALMAPAAPGATTPPPTSYQVVSNYMEALENDLFDNPDSRRRAYNAVVRSQDTKAYGHSKKSVMIDRLNKKPSILGFRHRENTTQEIIDKRVAFEKYIAIYGLSSDDLINDRMSSMGESVTLSSVFKGGTPDFTAFPIIVDGDINKTIEAIKKYDSVIRQSNRGFPNRFPTPLLDELSAIAETYDIPLKQLVASQYEYLSNNNFFDK